MSNVEKSVDVFKQGFNCAQAIISVYGEELGLNKTDALRLSAAFGAGIARTGSVCGAVSGALMVVGLRHAKGLESKEKVIATAQEFLKVFAETCGSTECRELLGVDLGTPEGAQRFKDKDLLRSRCTEFVRAAAEILEGITPKKIAGGI